MRQFKPGQLQTGSIYPITASSALTASYLLGSISIDTGSLVTTASFNAFTASYTTGSFTGSFIGTLNGTASYATHALTASYARTASYVTPLQQNVIITGSIYIPDNTYSIYFSGSNAASRLTWNDTDGTLDLGLKGGNVTLQIGQEQVVRVVNKTGANLLESEYKVARIRRVDEGGAQGQRLAVVLAQANNDANSVDTLGIVTENIDDNQEGFITNSGLVRNINTTGTLQGETWTDGDVLYLSPTTPGALTTTKPQAPDHTVIMGYVVYAHNNQGKIFVKVDNGYEIDELHNVRITTASLTPGQLLVRSGSAATGVWINTNQLTGSYSLTGSLNANAITGSFTGSFYGDGSQLTGIVSSKWTGSNPISRQSDVTITGSLRTRNTLGSGINTALSQLIYQDTASVDWRTRYLNDLNDITSIDWHFRNAYDSFGTSSFDWDSRSAWDLNNDVSIDWDNRQLIATDGSTITVDWENGLFTGSLFGTASNAVSSSYAVTASYLDNYIPPFPYTGSALITGSLTVIGPATFYGTASFINVTASNLFISESFISVNVFEPVERFGGIKVYDSGSISHQATASLAWDSLHNHWVYQNVDGLTYTGGMLLAGPRNTGSLGDEPNLTKWFVPRSDGGDHLDNSQIYSSGSVTLVTGSLTVTNGVTASLQGTASFATSASQATSASFAQTSSKSSIRILTSFDTRSFALTMVESNTSTTTNNPAPIAIHTGTPLTYTVTGGIGGILNTTSSFATSASYTQTSSFATSASFASTATTASHALQANNILPLGGNKQAGFITYVNSTGSYQYVKGYHTFKIDITDTDVTTINLTGSLIATSITSSLQGTASFANAATSASFAVTASHALNSTLPAGSTGWIQFKGNSGNFDASSEFVFDKTHLSLTNGKSVSATGDYSHAEGNSSKAKGDYSHAEGISTTTVGQFSHAEGNTNSTGMAAYSCSITLGIVELSASSGDLTGTYADGTRFYYTDISTIGNTIYSSIVTGSSFNGTNTVFQLLNDNSTTINPAGILDKSGDILDTAGGLGAHAEGESNIAIGDGSHAEGQSSTTWGEYSHAEGSSITYGAYSHAEGSSATTYGAYSHAEGSNAITIAAYSHAEGESTYAGHQAWYANVAAGKIVFPSYYGDLTSIAPPGSQLLVDDNVQQSVLIHEVASIIYSGSGETEITLVDSTYDPQVGLYVGLVGNPLLTYGDYTIGSVSHAEGQSTTTLGSYSHANGNSTTAHGYYQTVVGQYNAPVQVSSSFVIGNGDSGTPSNLLVAYGNTVQVTGSIGIHNAVSATLTSLSASFGTTPTSTYSIPVQPNGGAWFEYVIRSGSNARTGQIMAVWDDTLVNFTDTTTTDLGDTSGVTLAVTNDTSNITFDATATTDNWSLKAIVRYI